MAQSESARSSNLLWVLVAGFLGIFAIGSQKPSADKASTPRGAEHRESKPEQLLLARNREGPMSPLANFFATRTEQSHSFSIPKTDDRNASDWPCLIVTVPDPIDSQFGFAFDYLIDATQRALETQQWVLDRAWLPWETDKRNALRGKCVRTWKDLASVVCPLWVDCAEGNTDGKRHKREPGVLLFRSTRPHSPPAHQDPNCEKKSGTKSDPRLLLVFLVGEHPMSGIHKRAFTGALDLICRLRSPEEKQPINKCRETVRVIGPYFTGSWTSMRLAMGDPKVPNNWDFEVISGAATGIEIDPHRCSSDVGKHKVKFHATVIPVKQVLRATLNCLEKRDNSVSNKKTFQPSPELAEKVALLVESNTGYGRSRSVSDSALEKSILQLYFPLHIAGLRYRYDRAQQQKEDQLGLPSFDDLVPRLDDKLVLDREGIPPQDPATTSSVNGEVLKNLLSIIRRRRKRYVGIIASDPRDQIFLTRAVREHCPGVQVFLIDNDQMFNLPEYAYYLKGTIIGSTYPLLSENQFWTNREADKRLCFPSQPAQGYYNAILAQIHGAGGG